MKMPYSRLLPSLLLATGLALSAGAQARSMDDIQFNQIRCDEFIQDIAQADEDAIGYVFMWLDGYLSGVSGDTMLRWQGLETFSDRLINFCAASPQTKVLDAARGVGINY